MEKENQEIVSKKEQAISTPAEMIKLAVAGGADLEKLEKLLNLQERWEANESKKAYHVAMAKFKENPPKINKDKSVSYKEVHYNHASLANIVDKITTELSKHGLSASWSTQQNGAITVTCHITHSLGHTEKTTLTAPADSTGSKNSIQAIGSTITYLQRYTLLSSLGLATCDQDADGQIPEECITEEQVHAIRDMLISLGMEGKERKFLDFLRVETLEKMPASKYPQAMSALEERKKQMEGKNANG